MKLFRKIIPVLSVAAVFAAYAGTTANAVDLTGYIESFDNIVNAENGKKVNTVFGDLTPVGNTAATAATADLTQSASDSGDGVNKVSANGLYGVKLGTGSSYGLGVWNTEAKLIFNQDISSNESLYFSFDAYQYKNEGATDGSNTIVSLTDTSGNNIFSYKFDVKQGKVNEVYIGNEKITSPSEGIFNSGDYSNNTLAYLSKPIRVELSYDGTDGTLIFTNKDNTLTFQHKLSDISSVGAFTIKDNSDDPARMYTIDNLFAGTSKSPYAVTAVEKIGGRVYGNDDKAGDTYKLTVTPYNGTVTSVDVDLDGKTIESKSVNITGGNAWFGIVVIDDADEDGEVYLNGINESSFGVSCGFN